VRDEERADGDGKPERRACASGDPSEDPHSALMTARGMRRHRRPSDEALRRYSGDGEKREQHAQGKEPKTRAMPPEYRARMLATSAARMKMVLARSTTSV
jgi:hypothetical protein